MRLFRRERAHRMVVKKSKGRSGPIPDASDVKVVAYKLSEALATEYQYDLNCERKPGEVTLANRDAAVHALRFLKIWFDVPKTVFFSAVYYLDQFLARLKVQEKYLACLTVSCFNIAAEFRGFKIDASQLVMLSQSKCTVKDMQRMSTIITQKLSLGNLSDDRTALDFMNICLDIFKSTAIMFNFEMLLHNVLKYDQLCTRLEVIVADSSYALYKPLMLALAFIHHEVERTLARLVPYKCNYYTRLYYVLVVTIELQTMCQVNSDEFKSCLATITKILKKYDSHTKTRHCQKLMWRFSNTLFVSKSHNFYSILNTVEEE